MKKCLFIILFCFVYLHSEAQKYFKVTHSIDTASYAGINISLDTIGAIQYNNSFTCDSSGPNALALNNKINGLKYSFSKPVKYLNLRFVVLHELEVVAIYINGNKYTLAASNLFSLPNCGNLNVGLILNGELIGDTVSNSGLHITELSGIDSLRVMHNGKQGGCIFGLEFGIDTAIKLEPFHDSVFCAGDSLSIRYTVELDKNINNIFKAQLSSPNGSFNNPIDIGSITTPTSDTITCMLPDSILSGTGYRIRVVSSATPDTSSDNGVDLRIGNLDSANVNRSTNSPVCTGNAVKFFGSSNDSSTMFKWTGPNSFYSSLDSPLISVGLPIHNGNYTSTVSLHGCVDIDTIIVTINQTPSKPTISNNSPVCAGDTLQFTSSTSTNGVTYTWSGPNSFSDTGQTLIRVNSDTSMSGVYTVTVSKNSCSNEDTTHVLVKPLPAAVTLTNNTPLCDGDTLKLFSTTSSSGASYSWSGPGNFSANAQNTSRANGSPNNSGWYVLNVAMNGCVYTDSTHANIYQIPAPPLLSYNNPLCVGDTLKLIANSALGTNFNWMGPNNFSSTDKNPVKINASVSDTGKYVVTTSANGCTSPADSISVTINPQPFVVILSSKDSICDGDQVTFTAFANNAGNNPQYQWYVNVQAVGTGSSYTTSGLKHGDVVRVDMTESTKCAKAFTDPSNDIQMSVFPWLAPGVSITSDKTGAIKPYEYITFTATTVDAGANPLYQWKRNGADVIGAQGNTWSANTLNDNDNISVEIVSDYRCPQPTTAASNGIVVRILTSVEDIKSIKDLRLYPNPNDGSFTIEGTLNSSYAQLEIVDVTGKQVYDEYLVTDNVLRHKVQLGTIPNGIYLLKIFTEDDVSIIRFIVQ